MHFVKPVPVCVRITHMPRISMRARFARRRGIARKRAVFKCERLFELMNSCVYAYPNERRVLQLRRTGSERLSRSSCCCCCCCSEHASLQSLYFMVVCCPPHACVYYGLFQFKNTQFICSKFTHTHRHDNLTRERCCVLCCCFCAARLEEAKC